MPVRRLLRPVVLALAVGCGSKSAEQKDLENQRDSRVYQRQVLQMQQITLQNAAQQVVTQNPPDAATKLASLVQ
jgi:hypothetical protein